MNPHRLVVRFRLASPPADLSPAIDVFHRCIQRGLVEGLVLDVADYRHVPDGPGVLLVGHDVDYGVNDVAFTVTRKHSTDDDAAAQLRDALRMGLGTITAIEDEGTFPIDVDRSRFTVGVFDRSLGSRDEVEAELRKAVEAVTSELYTSDVTIAPVEVDDDRVAPELLVEVSSADAAAAALSSLGGSRAPGQSPWDIPVERAKELLDAGDAVLVDVREDSEYETYNLGGTLIPLGQLSERLDELDRSARVVVHCRAGRRGATAVQQLRDAGFEDAWNMRGALAAWRERIDPSTPVL